MDHWPRSLLPRILYIGDVPVANAVGGELLLYRLFQRYPKDRLWVMSREPSRVDLLQGVTCAIWRPALARLMTTRSFRWASLVELYRAMGPSVRVSHMIRGARPDAIVTVLHGSGWLMAWWAARRYRLPLAVIVHDDRQTIVDTLPGWFRDRHATLPMEVFREAAARFVISPEMREAYRGRGGVESAVLYPSLAAEAAIPAEPLGRVGDGSGARTFLYAGSVHSDGIVRQLMFLGREVAARGHRLLVLTPQAEALRQDRRMAGPGIEIRDPVAPEVCAEIMRNEADILVAGTDSLSHSGRLLFPTKLVEYTAAGLPILLCGPADSAAVRWASGPPLRAEVVPDPVAEGAMAAAVERLASDGALRLELARNALAEARERFSHDMVFGVFVEGILEALGTRR